MKVKVVSGILETECKALDIVNNKLDKCVTQGDNEEIVITQRELLIVKKELER